MNGTDPIKALESLKARLATLEYVSLRGLHAGPFLSAKHCGRAIEASTNDGQWWIEMWERSEDKDAQPVAEHYANSEQDAYDTIMNWLGGEAAT